MENTALAFLCRDSDSLDAIFLVLNNPLALREAPFKDGGISFSISDWDSGGDLRPDDGSMPISASLTGNLRFLLKNNNEDDMTIFVLTTYYILL